MSVPLAPGLAAASRINDIEGDAGSADRLAAISGSVVRTGRIGQGPKLSQAKLASIIKKLQSGLRHLAAGAPAKAVDAALAALKIDERYGLAWHVMAIALEKTGDLDKAFTAYEAALRLMPDDPAIIGDLGSLAHRLGYLEIAEKLYLKHLAVNPGNPQVINNLAAVLRDDNRYGEAIELISGAIGVDPEMPLLWNTLGTIVSDRGDMEGSLPFYDEAIRLDPDFYKAHYNRATVRMGLGDAERALTDIDAALVGVDVASDAAAMKMAKSFTQMILGDLVGGFETYESRFDPALSEAVSFQTYGERWAPGVDLSGKSLLVYGEQGLGDEILFANLLGDLVEAVGPEGRVILATEKRLTPLFQRSYPRIETYPHRTVSHMGRLTRFVELDEAVADIDFWSPMGSLFREFRDRIERFPDKAAYLTPDPERVAHWRRVLDEQGPMPKVGVVWKSLIMKGARARSFTPFDYWAPVFAVPGVQFVNLQYGDCSAEAAQAQAAGLNLWTPPGIDLKADLDEVAALCCALDLFVGPMTATTNIAAACGVRTWIISTPDAWPKFGTDRFPCYPSVRLFPAEGFGKWEGVMARLGGAVRDEVARPPTGIPAAA